MTGKARTAWQAFKAELPWLKESDRVLVEIAATIRGRLMAGEDVGVSALNQLRMCAAQMGATPADRSKIAVPDEPEEDPSDRFFN
jgi:translation initiation factor IF-3